MARGGQVLGDSTLTERSVKAAQFVQKHLYQAESNILLRSCYTAVDGGVAQMYAHLPYLATFLFASVCACHKFFHLHHHDHHIIMVKITIINTITITIAMILSPTIP